MPYGMLPTPPIRSTGIRLRTRVCPQLLVPPRGQGGLEPPLPAPGKYRSSLALRRVSSVCEAVSQGTGLPFCWVKDNAAYLPGLAQIPASG